MMTPEIRQLVHERTWPYLRNELSSQQTAEFEQLLLEYDDAANHVSQLHTLLQAQRAPSPEVWAPAFNNDALFARIEAQIDGTDTASNTDGDAITSDLWGRWRGRAMLALVAVALAGLAVALTRHTADSSATNAPSPAAALAELSAPAELVATAAQPAVAAASAQPELPTIEVNRTFDPSLRSLSNDVRVAATTDAIYALRPGSPAVLDIDAGTVVVEYVPRTGAGLRVEANGLDFDVVGTIFVVDASESDAYVELLWGSVNIEQAGDPIRLEPGQRFVKDGAVVDMAILSPTLVDSQVRNIFDVNTHAGEVQLARQNAAAIDYNNTHTGDARAARAPAERAEVGATELIGRGRVLLGDGDVAAAARAWERALGELPDGDTREATLRLDLANLYRHRLHDPDAAAEQLAAFLQHFPDDPDSGSVRDTLCAMTIAPTLRTIHCAAADRSPPQ